MQTRSAIIFTMVLITGTVVPVSVQAQDEDPIVSEVKKQLKNTNKPFTMVVFLKVKKGAGAKFEKAFAKAVAGTRKEKGNITYELNKAPKYPNDYVVYERWKNLDALKFHVKTKHIKNLLAEIGDMLVEPPVVKVFVPLEKTSSATTIRKNPFV